MNKDKKKISKILRIAEGRKKGKRKNKWWVR